VAKKSKARGRPVDRAMRAERSEKGTMRALWMEALRPFHERNTNQRDLLYVFLPGSDGLEIELLAQNKFISLTETGGIAQDSMLRIAAVESSKLAVGALQKKFPGLKIYETDVKGLVRGEGLLTYPDGEHRQCCRACVLNLDLNERLLLHEDGHSFPILRWIQKIAEIHAVGPKLNWCLYLTLHGEIGWGPQVSADVTLFLRENFNRAQDFSLHARNILGNDLHQRILGGGQVNFSNLSRELQQKVLMLFVPKKIADLIRPQMWRLETKVNLHYGQPEVAPMVSWIIEFNHDPRAAATPDAVYLESVNGVLASAGHIDADGNIVTY
jgi:hypothetical protein